MKIWKMVHKTDLRFNHPVKEHETSKIPVLLLKRMIILKIIKLRVYLNIIIGTVSVQGKQLTGANLVLVGKDMSEELPLLFRNVQHYQYPE